MDESKIVAFLDNEMQFLIKNVDKLGLIEDPAMDILLKSFDVVFEYYNCGMDEIVRNFVKTDCCGKCDDSCSNKNSCTNCSCSA